MFQKKSAVIALILNGILCSQLYATALTPEMENQIYSFRSIQEVEIDKFIELYNRHENFIVIDSRTVKDRNGGFIEDSISLPDTDTTPITLKEIIATKSQPVMFYCNGVKCGRSAVAALVAAKEGYSNIYWFKGGWEAWTANGMPIDK